MKTTLLIADDDQDVVTSLSFLLSDEGFDIIKAHSVSETMRVIKEQSVDLLLTDMNFYRDTTSGDEGIALVSEALTIDSNLPIIVMTGWGTIDIAVSALKAGARDFIQKPWNDDHLIAAIHGQLRASKAEKKAAMLQRQNQLLNGRGHPRGRTDIVARSAPMRELLAQIDELAPSDMNILLTGDNGTGKSMLAYAIHRASKRADQTFVAVNMGAIPDNLFESEMFGHVKGAFTDAREARTGRIEMAQTGSLFLDEIANIPMALQAKLLRVLEEQQFERVGCNKSRHADVRVISATNADLAAMISAGEFRQDLFYRLNTVELRVPSLTERADDIVPLAEHFLRQFARKYNKPPPAIAADAAEQLTRYHWPGNIRELSHLMERLLFTNKGGRVEFRDLPLNDVLDSSSDTVAMAGSSTLTLDEIEQRVLAQRLEHHQGNVTKTAESLGLSRSGYYRRVNKHERH